MKKKAFIIFLSAISFMVLCRTVKPSLYTWGQFNIKSAYEFVNIAENLPLLTNISIVDTKYDGNEFKVNKQSIFIDTTQTDKPNYYSYIKRAKEIGIDEASLLVALNSFYKIGVNEYRQKDNYYLFPVVTNMFTNERGYLYSINIKANQGDTIKVNQGNLDYKLILVKRIDGKWFEYVSDK